MSVSITIEPDDAFLKAAKALKDMPKAYPRAAASAINNALVTGRKVAAMGVRERYNIASAAVKKEMDLKKARRGDLEGHLEAKGRMIPATEFKPKPKMRVHGKPVSITVVKGGGGKVVQGGFWAKGRIWERMGDERYPIHPVSVIGLPFMIAYQGISDKVQDTIGEAAQRNLEREIKAFLSGARK